jgi:uncharacterized SAM-binding protein YcdF (DUF218 family)
VEIKNSSVVTVEGMLCTETDLPFKIDDKFLNPLTWCKFDANKILCDIEKSDGDSRLKLMIDSYRDVVRGFYLLAEKGTPRPSECIIVFGFALNEDGSMRDDLINRLHSALSMFHLQNSKAIIVTGGNPKNGVTEAQAMQNWLMKKGVPIQKIICESLSNDTVQNIQNIVPLLQQHQFKEVLLVTSKLHILRAFGLLSALTSRTQMHLDISINWTFDSIKGQLLVNPQDAANEMFLLWKDIGRIFNVWKYRTKL